MLRQDEADFVAHSSRLRLFLIAACALGFVVLGVWMTVGEPSETSRYSPGMIKAIGAINVVFFGACGVEIVKRFFGPSEQLRIGRAGIRCASWSEDTIPWSEIMDVSIWSHRGSKSIILHLRDPSLYPGRGLRARLAGANRMLTGGDVAIAMTATDKSVGETLAAIDDFRAGAGSRAGS